MFKLKKVKFNSIIYNEYHNGKRFILHGFFNQENRIIVYCYQDKRKGFSLRYFKN